MGAKQKLVLPARSEGITIFVSGNELSTLKPCGCAEGQLGSFERRAAVLKDVPPEKRLLINTGNLIAKDTEQDIIKFNIITQALSLLDYDMVNMSEKDIEIAQSLALIGNTSFDIITSASVSEVNIPAKFEKKLQLGTESLIAKVATIDTDSEQFEKLENLFEPDSALRSFNILIVNNCDVQVISRIAETDLVDVVICSAETDEPKQLYEKIKKPMVITVGHLGQYVGKIQVQPTGKDDFKIAYQAIAIKEALPADERLVHLYKAYQKIVKDLGLLAKAGRFELPDGLEYIGSASCKLCHDYEYKAWSQKSHAKAFKTLKDIGSEYDPECVLCHVVGLEYKSGFISEEKTPQLKDVGCETCHGPGSEHLKTMGKAKTVELISDCTTCHTPERSPNYAGNEQNYRQKIVHWKEQTADNPVK